LIGEEYQEFNQLARHLGRSLSDSELPFVKNQKMSLESP